jgi:hypothetical protein
MLIFVDYAKCAFKTRRFDGLNCRGSGLIGYLLKKITERHLLTLSHFGITYCPIETAI